MPLCLILCNPSLSHNPLPPSLCSWVQQNHAELSMGWHWAMQETHVGARLCLSCSIANQLHAYGLGKQCRLPSVLRPLRPGLPTWDQLSSHCSGPFQSEKRDGRPSYTSPFLSVKSAFQIKLNLLNIFKSFFLWM